MWQWLGQRRFIVGIVVIAWATAALLFFARDKRFHVGGVAINPSARIDPETTYELVLWEEQLIVPWAPKTQSEMLMDGIRRFQELRPNVAVSYLIMEKDEARDKLAASLASGAPPDVYGTARGVVHHPAYQVPASPYAPAALTSGHDELSWTTVATSMLRHNDVVWGWPKALWWHAFLKTAHPSPPAADVDAASLSDTALGLDVVDVLVLEQWMTAFGAPFYVDAKGNLLFTEERLARAAVQLRLLQAEGVLPDGLRAAQVARSRVEALLTGRAAVIGPVGPHLAQAIFRHTPERFRLALTPGITVSSEHPDDAGPMAIIDVGAYFVFRPEPYEGDGHTRLAAELADFLAAHAEQWLVETLGLIPIRTEGRAAWDATAPLDVESRSLLQSLADDFHPPPYSFGGMSRHDALRAAVAPHWEAFWRDTTSPERFAADTAAALQAVLDAP